MLAEFKLTEIQIVMLAAGILIVAFMAMRFSQRRVAQRRGANGANASPSQRISADRAAGPVRDQLEELMVQLEELTRNASGQIEVRFAKLEALLTEADEKIATLKSLLKPPETDAAPPAPPAPAAQTQAVKPEHLRVYELADAGRSPVEIAREVGRDTGEVELILALRKKD